MTTAKVIVGIISDVRFVTLDPLLHTATITGTREELNLAGWLLKVLQSRGPGSTYLSALLEPSVRVFRLRGDTTQQRGERLAQTVRAITGVRRCLFGPGLLAVRGSAEQIALTAWMLDRIDAQTDPGAGKPAVDREFRIAGPLIPERAVQDGNVVHVIYPPTMSSNEDSSEMSSLLRLITTCFAWWNADTGPLFVRGPEESIGLVEWLTKELYDRSATRFSAMGSLKTSEPVSFQTSGRDEVAPIDRVETVTSVTFLQPSVSIAQLLELAARLKNRTRIWRTFTYIPSRAIVVRGTVDEIETARPVLSELVAQFGQ